MGLHLSLHPYYFRQYYVDFTLIGTHIVFIKKKQLIITLKLTFYCIFERKKGVDHFLMTIWTFYVPTTRKMLAHSYVCTQRPSLSLLLFQHLISSSEQEFPAPLDPWAVIQGSAAHFGKHTHMCTQTENKIRLPATSESKLTRRRIYVKSEKAEITVESWTSLNKGLLSSCRLVKHWCSRSVSRSEI